jgi:hypothetical protein
MKYLKLTTVIFISLILLVSCSGNNAASIGRDNSMVNSANPGTSDDARFSCKIDGKDFSESGCTGNINAAFRIKGDNKEQIFFMLANVNDATQKLNFEIPGRTGSTTIKNSPPHYSYEGLVLKGFVTYTDDPVTVNIISISSTRVSGTFSGTYTLSKRSGGSNAKQTIEVADGKFDIPFSTSADWKKMYNAE